MLVVRSYSVLFGRVAARQVSLGLGFDLMGLWSSMTGDNNDNTCSCQAHGILHYLLSHLCICRVLIDAHCSWHFGEALDW